MRNFRCDDLKELTPGMTFELDRTESNHLFKILRANPGEQVGLLDGCGRFGTAIVEHGRKLRLEAAAEIPFPSRKIHLYLAPPRRQKMDQILREATELGVYRIIPVLCGRCVSVPDGQSSRWEDLLFEACKQSGNPWLPQVENPVKFPGSVEDARQNCAKSFFGAVREADGVLESMPEHIGFFVGPEGGFTDAEESALKDFANPMHIGNWVLRVETAAICGIARLLA